MSCDVVTKFAVTRGQPNNYEFTIKAQGSTLPMVIVDPGDTFTAELIQLSDSSVVLTKSLVIADAANGKVSLLITEVEANALTGERGSKTDRYYLRPVYKLVIACSTTNNGDFIAKVPEVYVD
jgi:hypothetical protein